MKKYIITDEIYHQGFIMIVNCSEKQFNEHLKKKYNLKTDLLKADGKFLVIERTNKKTKEYECRSFLWLQKFDWTIQGQCILVHELQHLCFNHLTTIGIKHEDSTDEAYSYYIAYLLEKCCKALKNLEKKPKKVKRKIKKKK
jgi:hypothetical protein